MRKLLILLCISAPLVSMAAATYQVTFKNTTANDIYLTVDNSRQNSCMKDNGPNGFKITANNTHIISITDSNAYPPCSYAYKIMSWVELDNGKYVTFNHWNDDYSPIFGGGTWYTKINGSLVKSATCGDHNQNCFGRQVEQNRETNIYIELK